MSMHIKLNYLMKVVVKYVIQTSFLGKQTKIYFTMIFLIKKKSKYCLFQWVKYYDIHIYFKLIIKS